MWKVVERLLWARREDRCYRNYRCYKCYMWRARNANNTYSTYNTYALLLKKAQKKDPLRGVRNRSYGDIFHCALANAVNYIFLPTFVFFATGAALAAVALGALGALAFTTVASSTASVFFVDLRERRVLGLAASSVETTLPNV